MSFISQFTIAKSIFAIMILFDSQSSHGGVILLFPFYRWENGEADSKDSAFSIIYSEQPLLWAFAFTILLSESPFLSSPPPSLSSFEAQHAPPPPGRLPMNSSSHWPHLCLGSCFMFSGCSQPALHSGMFTEVVMSGREGMVVGTCLNPLLPV